MIGLHLSRRFTVKHVYAYGVLFHLHHILSPSYCNSYEVFRHIRFPPSLVLTYFPISFFCFLGKDEQVTA